LYLVGHDTLGKWDGEGWSYYLPDALGSVRQVADGAGAVVSSREWTPFGVELALSEVEGVGAAQAGLGYTGEWWDADAALLYLRARWYAPGVGRFTRRDPWRGDPRQPSSFNLYIYVCQNPVNATDPSGLRPAGPHEIGDITEDINTHFQYSCNCGWIDWWHAIAGMQDETSLAHTIFSRLEADVDWSAYPLWTGNRGVQVQSFAGRGIIIIPIEDIAVVPEWTLSTHLFPIAAGIFIEHSERVERIHGLFPPAHSYFAEEDLPSDLIGLYIAEKMHHGDASFQEALEMVTELCGVVGKQESLDIYENEYCNGAGFIEGWRRWDARLYPITESCVSCDLPRRWPSQFSRLVSGAVYSERNVTWWWYENPWADGAPTETNVEGVFALEEFGLWNSQHR